jgi:hypothetical protein
MQILTGRKCPMKITSQTTATTATEATVNMIYFATPRTTRGVIELPGKHLIVSSSNAPSLWLLMLQNIILKISQKIVEVI